MTHPVKVLTSMAATLMIAGCTAIPVHNNAKGIRITSMEPVGDCKLLGEVYGSQGNWITGIFTSNLNLLKGARNDMRNQAADLGANYVKLTNSRFVGSIFISGSDNATLVGNAYRCKQMPFSSQNDSG